MAIHVIPETEKEQHVESPDCNCEPELKMDPQSGEMVWVHNLVDAEGLIDDLIQL